VCATYGTVMLLYVLIGSTILSMGLWLMYNIVWMFIGCGLRDLVPLVCGLSVLVTMRVYAGGQEITKKGNNGTRATCIHTHCTKTERLPTEGPRSRNPQPINIHIILYNINHSRIDKIVLPIIK
jgi:hypothetical protein